MKFVHWYDCQVEPTEDPISLVFNPEDFSDFADEEDDEDEALDEEMQEALYEEEQRAKAQQVKRNADDLIKSIQDGGKQVPLTADIIFCCFLGQMDVFWCVRYENGNYSRLTEKILIQWEDDLEKCAMI